MRPTSPCRRALGLALGAWLLAAGPPPPLPPGHAAVELKIDQIDINLLTNGDTRVEVSGHVANGSLAPLDSVEGSLQVRGDARQQPLSVLIPPIAQLKPLGREPFKVSCLFPRQQVMHPQVRPVSLSYKPELPLRIADWLLGLAGAQLERHHIPVEHQLLVDLRRRRLAALEVLRTVPPGDKDYQEARRKQGQILVVWAEELLAQGRRDEAIPLLQQVDASNPYAAEARKLLK